MEDKIEYGVVEYEQKGIVYRGSYVAEDGLVEVRYKGRRLITHSSGGHPIWTARMLLRELADLPRIPE